MAWSIFKEGGGPLVAVGWAQQFLRKLGAPVTPGNVEFVYQWEKSEGGGGKYNPLNQGPVAGKPYLTTTGEQFGGGAADFASWDAGLEGAYDFLHYKNYSGVLQNLLSNNPVAARQALWASPWAASHYGYGSNWAFVAVPGGTPVLPSGGGTGGAGSTDASLAVDLNPPVDPKTCAIGFSSPGPSLLGGGTYNCILPKNGARGLLAMAVMTGALIAGLVGVTLLIAYGLKRQVPVPGTRRLQEEFGLTRSESSE